MYASCLSVALDTHDKKRRVKSLLLPVDGSLRDLHNRLNSSFENSINNLSALFRLQSPVVSSGSSSVDDPIVTTSGATLRKLSLDAGTSSAILRKLSLAAGTSCAILRKLSLAAGTCAGIGMLRGPHHQCLMAITTTTCNMAK